MSEQDLEARLDAVERALTDGETDLARLEDAADLAADLDHVEERLETLESTVADLEAAVQAVRGYAGNVRAVNRDVERRASAALAKAETLETAIDAERTALPADSSDWSGGDADTRSGTLPAGGRVAATRADSRATAPHTDGRGSDGGGAGDRRTGDQPGSTGQSRRTARGGGSDGQLHAAAPDADTEPDVGPDHEGRPVRSDANAVSRAERPTAGDRVTGNALGTGRRTNGSDGDDQSRRTSQFIERVRDAL